MRARLRYRIRALELHALSLALHRLERARVRAGLRLEELERKNGGR